MPIQRVELFHEVNNIVVAKQRIQRLLDNGNLVVSVLYKNGTLLVVYFEQKEEREDHIEQL